MTPKEKAEALIKRFNKVEIFLNIEPSNIETNLKNVDCDANKQCALIAVNEMLEELDHLAFDDFYYGTSKMMYWVEVKEEIKNL